MSGPAFIENVLYPTFDTSYIIPFQDEVGDSYSSVVQYLHFKIRSQINDDIPCLYQAQKLKFEYNPELKEALKNTSGEISFPFLQDQYHLSIYSKVLELLRATFKGDENQFRDISTELGI
jgi:hypothetical protein